MITIDQLRKALSDYSDDHRVGNYISSTGTSAGLMVVTPADDSRRFDIVGRIRVYTPHPTEKTYKGESEDWLEEYCERHGHPTMYEHDCLSNVMWRYGEQPTSLVGHQFEPLLDRILRDVEDLKREERRILLRKLQRESLTEAEKEVLAQALMDYREGVSDNCEDESESDQLLETVDSLEQKLLP